MISLRNIEKAFSHGPAKTYPASILFSNQQRLLVLCAGVGGNLRCDVLRGHAPYAGDGHPYGTRLASRGRPEVSTQKWNVAHSNRSGDRTSRRICFDPLARELVVPGEAD